MRLTYYSKMMLAGVVLLAMATIGTADTMVFQQGLNGYAGCEDTSLRTGGSGEVRRNYNYGGADYLMNAYTLSAAGHQVLVRFNDMFGDGANQIPTDAVVTSATLKMCVYDLNNTGDVRLYRMLSDWVEGFAEGAYEEGAVCTNYRAYSATEPDYWGTATAAMLGPVASDDYPSSTGGDYWNAADPIRVQSAPPSSVENWQEWDITGFVQDWQDGTMENNGVYTYNLDRWLRASYHSSEYADPCLRPKLEIEYTAIEWDPCLPD